MALETAVHRSGSLKQSNKQHKTGRHRSKGSISKLTKGKVSVKVLSKKAKAELNKEQRRHQALQIRRNKRDEVLSKKRSLGGMDYAPFLVCIVPLHKDFDPSTTIELLTQCDSEAVVNKSPSGVTHICLPRFKQRFSFIVPPRDNNFAILDALKVCDTVLYLISAANGVEDDDLIDKWGNNMLLSSFAQGLPTSLVGITNLDSIAPKKRHEAKQYIQKLVEKWFPSDKVVQLDKDADAVNVLRRIGGQKRKSVLYRDRRPHLYAEKVEYVPDERGTLGTMKVTGFLRGASLTANGLIHIPGLGDFQMSQIDAPPDPYSWDKNRNKDDKSMEVGEEESLVKVLQKCDPANQESLQRECQPEPEDAEEPLSESEEVEMQEDEAPNRKKKGIPKGWSDYQAAWIPEDDDSLLSDSDGEDEESEAEDMEAMSEEKSEASDKEDCKEIDMMTESEVVVNADRYDQELDLLAEKEDLEKMKAAKSDREFPDEVDTPLDIPAKERFKKYCGLESFRSSPWIDDRKPSDYNRIFHFKKFMQHARSIIKEQENKDGVKPGLFITVHVKDVSQLMWSSFEATGAPVVLMGLFPYEQRMTVVSVVLKRTPNFPIPIKSKERLVFQCGYRRFAAAPIFSQHTNGSKHKFERFFQPDSLVVATFYAPAQFPPAPVLCYKEVNNELVLIATGSLLHCDSERLILKRIVLSGHPLKIHKKSAVIRFMFFNREDILHFKNIKLSTKMGRAGNIKEPLGTHGHMKCIFDGQLKSEDTVLLKLYKRVFPKWTYEDYTVNCLTNNEKMDM